MGFFFTDEKLKKTPRKIMNDNLAETYGCTICSRKDLDNKKEAFGSESPLLYFLSDTPWGKYSTELKTTLYKDWDNDDVEKYIRWNSAVHCFLNRVTPSPMDMACCKPSVISDIEATKPLIVAGFGTIPLKSFIGGNDITLWRGRLLPLRIGNHACWYYPLLHPSDVEGKRKYGFRSELDDVLEQDIHYLLTTLLEDYDTPILIESGYTDNVCSMNVLDGIIDGIHSLYGDHIIAVDIETTTLRPYGDDAEIWSIALSSGDRTIVFPLEYKRFFTDEQVLLIKRELEALFCNVNGIVAHNLKFELEWFLKFFGSQTFMRGGTWHDTMAQAYLLDERTSKHEGMLNLDILIKMNFGFNLKALSKVDNKKLKEASIENILMYNGLDAKYTHKLFMKQQQILLDKPLQICYNNLIETAKTLAITQSYGLNVDMEQLASLKKKYKDELDSIEKEMDKLDEIILFKKKYIKFNPLSYRDAVTLFRDVLNIPELKKTKKAGEYAVDDKVLTELSNNGLKVADYILQYRTAKKLISTYLDTVAEFTFNEKVYPNFNLYFTSTGRLSSGETTGG